MKTIKIFSISILAVFSLSLNAQIKIISNGSVGIGCTPYSGYKLHVNGITDFNVNGYEIKIDNYGSQPTIRPEESYNGYVGTGGSYWYKMYTYNIYRHYEHYLSDKKVKTNFRDVNNPFDIINKINAYQFDFTEDAFKSAKSDKKSELVKCGKDNYGFIAQEVKEVLPSMVEYDDSTDLYYLSYNGFIPILLQAVKELKNDSERKDSIILSMKGRLLTLEKEVSKINNSKNILKSTEFGNISLSSINNITSELFQNKPNPFSESTEISYYLPDNVSSAMLNIYDMQGSQIISIVVNTRGNASTIIKGSELSPGMYLYTLIADDKEVDTKRMILTD